MPRLFKAELLSLCTLIAACSDGDEQVALVAGFGPVISFSPMFSAFGGSHTYAVTPSVPAATEHSRDSDPPLASTLKWHVDDKVARLEPFAALPGAVKVTTRRVGGTDIEVQGKYQSGGSFRTKAYLNITRANDKDWDRGEARFQNGPQASLASLAASIDDKESCEASDMPPFPQDAACASCHSETGGGDSVTITPSQTAGYSDDQLIMIFTQGQKPAGGTFNSTLLRDRPSPDCIFAKFHAWSVDEEDELGLVLKLRSIVPEVAQELDL